MTAPPRLAHPTRASSLVFAGKVALHRARRAMRDALAGPTRLRRADRSTSGPVIAESRTPLWSDPHPAERAMQLGKVHNLRVACRALDGLVLPAGIVFGVWRHLGPPVRLRGYVPGRMLQQGCLVPAIGGGLCQLSNALYDVALQAGCRIVERHPHSRTVPGSAAALGRDATIAWNYVDLRFAPDRDLTLSVRMDANELVVRLLGGGAVRSRPEPAILPAWPVARSCATCAEVDCARHEGRVRPPVSRRAVLVDEAWPELRDYVGGIVRDGDVLGRPLDGAALRLPRYAWPDSGFTQVGGAPMAALRRLAAVRRAGPQGVRRREAELAGTRRIALSLARLLTADVTELVVAQSYLPFLWRQGILGGRRFSVLMTRLPIGVLQSRLDAAAATHPERASLADFRAPMWLAEAEAEALAAADEVVTPHADIAALFDARAVRLPWRRPERHGPAGVPDRTIAFAGPTIARKGAHAVREAASALDLIVVPLGAELEGADFWHGVRTRPSGGSVAAVVQPALVEDQPRRLLAALAAGIPVIASAACGLDPQPGLTLILPDDGAALVAALRAMPAFA